MAAKENIKGGEVLIRVPEELVLSADKAYQDPELNSYFDKYGFFYQKYGYNDDRILIVYALALLHRKEESNPWYVMINHIPDSNTF